jgi:hypothetical protein
MKLLDKVASLKKDEGVKTNQNQVVLCFTIPKYLKPQSKYLGFRDFG